MAAARTSMARTMQMPAASINESLGKENDICQVNYTPSKERSSNDRKRAFYDGTDTAIADCLATRENQPLCDISNTNSNTLKIGAGLSEQYCALRGVNDAYMGVRTGDMELLEELGFLPAAVASPADSDERPGEVPSVSSECVGSPPLSKKVCVRSDVVFHKNEYESYATGRVHSRSAVMRRRPLLLRGSESPCAFSAPNNAAFSFADSAENIEGAQALAGTSEALPMDSEVLEDASPQAPRFPGDTYTPRWVRGTGMRREGLCVQCAGGRWLLLKQSCYWYHMNYTHGVSPVTGLPYAPPIELRALDAVERGRTRAARTEALCPKCGQWVQLRGQASGVEGQRLSWWRHAQKCENGRRVHEGDVEEPVARVPGMCLEFRVSPSGELENVERLFGSRDA